MDSSERMCIVTGEHLEPGELIRFVRAPDGGVVPDLKNCLPGRGVWVRACRQAVDAAVADQRFPKAFRAKCSPSPDLSDRIRDLLRSEARQLLSLANKAGLVATGFEKTAEALRDGRAGVLIEAVDGAENGLRKLRLKCPVDCEIIASFDSNELGLALGRANVIHAAVARGALAEKLIRAVARLESFDAETAKHG